MRRFVGEYFGYATASPWNKGSDISTIIALLGGNAAVPAFYDARVGIVLNGSNVASWADARGAGFGKTLTATGTQQPAMSTSGGKPLITFNGTSNAMTTFPNAAVAAGTSASLFFVGSITTGGTSELGAFATYDNSAGFNGQGIATPSVTDITGAFVTAGTLVTVQTTVAPSTTRHLFLCSESGLTVAQIEIPPNAAATGTITNYPGIQYLTLFCSLSNGVLANFCAGTIVAGGVLTGGYSTTQRANLYSWAQNVWASS